MDTTPNRRWGRYSLRTLMVIVTIACVGFGWLGLKLRAKQRAREAVKAIQDLGGLVTYDDFGPQWARRLLGDDFFADVDIVDLSGARNPRLGLMRLREFPRLRYLNLASSSVTDADLIHLQGLTQLEGMSLRDTKITDVGLMHLKGLTNIKSLETTDTEITNTGAQEFVNARNSSR